MSNSRGNKTLTGEDEFEVDTINILSSDGLQIKNHSGTNGDILQKSTVTNELEWASVPPPEDSSITTAMIQDGAVTGVKIATNAITNDKIATNAITNDKITDLTITGGKLATDIAITTTGNVSLNGATTTLGNTLTKGIIVFNNGETPVGTLVPATGLLTMPTGTFHTGLNVGSSGELVVGAGVATFGAETRFGGELSMTTGGAEVFDMNAHNITDCGGIAMTTGGNITNVDTITCDTLNLNTALSMVNVSLDLGTGDLDCNNINATGSIRVDYGGSNKFLVNHTNGVVSCFGVGTQGGIIDSEGGIIRSGGADIETEGGELKTLNGDIDAGTGNISTTTTINCNSLNSNNILGTVNLSGIMNVGYGLISSNSSGFIQGYSGVLNINLYTGGIDCKDINTQNSDINTGTGAIECGSIDCKAIDTQNSNIVTGTGTITTGGLTGAGISAAAGTTKRINGFNNADYENDMPRIIDYRCITGDQYNHNITTSYTHPHTNLRSLNAYVPPSCMILVEVDMFYSSLNNTGAILYGRLTLSGTNTEVVDNKVNNTALCFTTTDTICVGPRAAYDPTTGRLHHEWVIKYPTTRRGELINIEPQFKVSSGSAGFYSGKHTSGYNFGMMSMKITSLPFVGDGAVVPVSVHIHTNDDY